MSERTPEAIVHEVRAVLRDGAGLVALSAQDAQTLVDEREKMREALETVNVEIALLLGYLTPKYRQTMVAVQRLCRAALGRPE